MKNNLANKITYSRFGFGVLMLVAIYFHSLVLFTVFYVIALITDILDGFIARKQRTSSNFGKIKKKR